MAVYYVNECPYARNSTLRKMIFCFFAIRLFKQIFVQQFAFDFIHVPKCFLSYRLIFCKITPPIMRTRIVSYLR